MANKPLIDYAYDVLKSSSSPIAFKELFENALKLSEIELSDDKKLDSLSPFYTQLTIDSRFIVLDGNVWDLRERYPFEYVQTTSEEDDEDEADNREEAAEQEAERRETFGEDIEDSDEEENPQPKGESVEIDEPNE